MSAKPSEDQLLTLYYTTGRDTLGVPPADWSLLGPDLWTNLAHATMLSEMKPPVLSGAEFASVKKALVFLDKTRQENRLTVDFKNPGQEGYAEDIHYWVESQVKKQAGDEVGGKIHTARSRNDQVNCDMRLHMRDELFFFSEAVLGLEKALVDAALAHKDVVMPGYTHHQHGAVSTLGFLWMSHASALERDLERLDAAYNQINACPLGSVMAFGTRWPINRERTAGLLAFDKVLDNNLDAVGSRGEAETVFVSALAMLANRLAGLSQDILLLTTEEFSFVKVHKDFTTGSSVMPQKRNMDFAEVTKAKAALLAGYLQGLLGMTGGNFSGYNRDTQFSKYLVLDAARELRMAPLALGRVMATLELDKASRKTMLDQATRGYLNAVDVADFLAAEKGLAFRSAHGVVREAVESCRAEGAPALTSKALNQALEKSGAKVRLLDEDLAALSDPAKNLAGRRNFGSPNPKDLQRQADALSERLGEIITVWKVRREKVDGARNKLFA